MSVPEKPPIPPAEEIEVEVLPPAESESPLLRFVAVLMDDLFVIPGTQTRIGLDPILGLFPGFGDTSANFISAVALLETVKKGLPKIVLARMALNILVNALIGSIPILGDAFSVWFKSNKRNYELLRRHARSGHPARASTLGDWLFVSGLVLLLLGAILLVAAFTVFLLVQILGLFGKIFGG